MIRTQPFHWPLKWLAYQAWNERVRYEYDRGPLINQRPRPAHTWGLSQLRVVYADAFERKARRVRWGFDTPGVPTRGLNFPKSLQIKDNRRSAEGLASRGAPGTTPSSTFKEQRV